MGSVESSSALAERLSATPAFGYAVVGLCAAVLALLGAAVRAGSGPLLDLDTRVSEALYAGDDRPAALTALSPGVSSPSWTICGVRTA